MTAPLPPPLHSLLAGTRLAAGLGQASVLPDLDFETFSLAGYVWDRERNRWEGPPGAPKNTKGLPVVGAANYAAHESAEVLLLAYDLKDGRGRRRWRPGMPPPADLFAHIASGGLLEAWNVAFERWVWELVCVPRMRWPAVHPAQWRCAAAKARAHALPGSLAAAGTALALATQKDPRGAALMRKFSMPRNPTKGDPRWRVPMVFDDVAERAAAMAAGDPRAERQWLKVLTDDAADSHAYADYNETDIAAEAEASARIPDLDADELAWWQVHEAINHRGVAVDVRGLEDAAAIVDAAQQRYNAELSTLTGVDSASKVQQLLGWLHSAGVHLDSLDEDAVADALQRPEIQGPARRVLEIRSAIGSASVKKVHAMRNAATPAGRLHDLYVYHGARTGRSTGDGPQPTNLPKAGPNLRGCGVRVKGKLLPGSGCGKHYAPARGACPHCGRPAPPLPPDGAATIEWHPGIAEEAIEALRTRSLDWVEYAYGDALHVVAGCLRGFFCASDGCDLISTDYNSIEAIGLAMLAGEQWRIDVFRSHGKIYEASASMTYGVPLDEFAAYRERTGQHHPLRQKGKISELAFGYGGWLGSAHAFGMPGSDEEIKEDILAWRRASPSVEWLWGGQRIGHAASIAEHCGFDNRAPLRGLDRWDSGTFLYGVEGAAVSALLAPGSVARVTRLDGTPAGVSFTQRGDALYCVLPSGRPLTYHRPRLQPGERGGYEMSYEGWNTNPKNGPKGWVRMRTWGSRLVENINQAACSDLLRFACRNLEAAGYPVVLHVYDEIVSEVPEGWGSLEEFESIVTRVPAWAADWPVRAPGGWRGKRYRKG